jgi:hypothetical protein
VTGTVKELTGHDPQRLERFLEQHPESYEHLLRNGESGS